MCADNYKKSEEYSRTRDSFEDLGVEEQAVFIVESAVNMIVKSVRKAGDAFSKAFEEIKVDVSGKEEAEAAEKKKRKPSATKAKSSKKSASKGASKSAKTKASSKSKSDS